MKSKKRSIISYLKKNLPGKKLKLLCFCIIISAFNSCSGNPFFNPLNDNSATKTIPYKTGVDEKINENVYKSVISNVVSISVTSESRGRFHSVPVKGEGSGIILNKDGYILTNYHVVEGSDTLDVTLSDKREFSARVVLENKENEVAIIKITGDLSGIQPVNLGDSDNLQVGQKVLAIGNSFGLSGTLTTGIISSLHRDLSLEGGTSLKDIIQTDAAINPGNSGGPLLNSNGEIIGINTAIFSPNGANVGIGFAIPINKLKDLINKAVLELENLD